MVFLFPAITFMIALYILMLRCRSGNPKLRNIRGWSYAHRGLHDANFPENSMVAFRRAVNSGYGIELDVHLMADGNLAVIHDALLLRTTGLPGRIEEMTAADLAGCKLTGCNETIPLFTDVLKMVDGRVPLIVEIKVENNNHSAVSEAVCTVLKEYKGVYCIESFDPRAVRYVRKYYPNIVRGQLAHNSLHEKSKVPFILRLAMTCNLANFLTVPDFVAYRFKDRRTLGNFVCRKFWGAQMVGWTIKTEEDWRTAVDNGWIPIFENFKP